MNIFVLDRNPIYAAQMQCDKHVVKMSLETAQLLCNAFVKVDPPYRRTHINHPCSIWTRTSKANFMWLVEHGKALCQEYTYRYGKVHKSLAVIEWCEKNVDSIEFPEIGMTEFPLCMEDEYRCGNVVNSYRRLYIQAKSSIAKWSKRNIPEWFTKGEVHENCMYIRPAQFI